MRQVVLTPEPDAAGGISLPLTVAVRAGRSTSTSNSATPISFDVKPALLAYARKRGTFRTVVESGPADATLTVASDFRFSSAASFHYAFKLEATLTAGGRVIGRYWADSDVTGGMIRLTSAADRAPTSRAFQEALDKIFTRIEADRTQIMAELGRAPAAVAAAPAAPAEPSYSSDADEPSFKLPERPDDFALVVGITKYQNLPPAEFAERDAQAVRRHLLALGYPERNVIFLTGAKAGRTGMEKYLGTWLPLNVKPDSKVFVYFSGHGAPDPATGRAYLVPWDGDAQFLKATAYPIQRLYRELDALKAKQVLLAMDACFSGAGGRSVLARGARPLVTEVDQSLPPGGKLVVLAAAGGDEITGTAPDQGHGLFTYYLLQGLDRSRGEATMKGLYDYLLPRVQDAARRDGRQQTPALMPAGSGAAGLR
jgi:hypothetical protein